MEENQEIYLSRYDFAFFAVDRTCQNEQETKVKLYSSNAGFIAILLWKVDDCVFQ